MAGIDPFVAFQARCEARALLIAAGEYSLQEAVDELQRDAEQTGLVDRFGQDLIQRVMSQAFSEATC